MTKIDYILLPIMAIAFLWGMNSVARWASEGPSYTACLRYYAETGNQLCPEEVAYYYSNQNDSK